MNVDFEPIIRGLMAKTILNFHFDYLTPSLSYLHLEVEKQQISHLHPNKLTICVSLNGLQFRKCINYVQVNSVGLRFYSDKLEFTQILLR